MAIHNPVIRPTPDSVREPASTTMPVSGFISPSLAGFGKLRCRSGMALQGQTWKPCTQTKPLISRSVFLDSGLAGNAGAPE